MKISACLEMIRYGYYIFYCSDFSDVFVCIVETALSYCQVAFRLEAAIGIQACPVLTANKLGNMLHSTDTYSHSLHRMKKTLLSIAHVTFASFIVCSIPVFAQRTVADLKPSHAVALERFLSKNKDYGFLSEKVLDADYLKRMREYFKRLKPYYAVGDFNRDSVEDFALVLSKKGEVEDQGEGMAETHRYNHSLAVIIFNGVKKGGFRQAFLEDLKVPTACFINVTDGKKKELYFGVFESDADTFTMTPVGRGYIIEYDDAP